jgi:hypothetical protein
MFLGITDSGYQFEVSRFLRTKVLRFIGRFQVFKRSWFQGFNVS